MARVLVTGASKGIGQATAVELARRGHEVIATARKVETLAALDAVAKLPLDVTDDRSVKEAVAAAGRIDVLFNNAGDIVFAPVESIPLDDARYLYELNVLGSLRMIQAVAPQMRERRAGTIVNNSSVVGRVALPLGGVYASTKFAIEGLSEALRFELGHFGVRVILVEPGATGTTAFDAPKAHLDAGGPYAGLIAQRGIPDPTKLTPPAEIARQIVDAIESKDDTFRFPVGDDAKRLTDARARQDDRELAKTLRGALNLDW